MKRGRKEQLLSRYLDGQLDARRAARVEALLAEDASLRAQAEAWRAIGDRLRGQAGEGPDPATAWADVRTAIARDRAEAPARPSHARGFGSRWAAASATLALLIAGAVFYLGRPGIPGSAPTASRAEQPVVEWAETELPGASTMVYKDEATGLTVIWLVEGNDTLENDAGS